MTMAWGLEARVPFLDHELVELATRCPAAIRLREGGKYPLKALARGLLPDAVIDRPKGYFPMPALKFVRGDFLAMMRDLVNSRACRERGIYQRAYVDQLLAAPDLHHTRIRGNKLMASGLAGTLAPAPSGWGVPGVTRRCRDVAILDFPEFAFHRGYHEPY
jgi:asparagine synthase (glutamine-hydrolysing)